MSALQDEITMAVSSALDPLRGEISALKAEIRRLRSDSVPDMLTTQEAAKVLKVDPQTIRRKVRSGAIDSRRVGSKILIPRSAVE